MVATYENPWMYNGKPLEIEDTEGFTGMVYLIENIVDNKFYVGKKFFWFAKHRLVNKKKKRVKAESDWKTYYGSSRKLLEDVERLGIDKFKRSVLHLCKTKTQCSFYELEEQITRDALLSESYYNEFIGCKINGKFLDRLEKF